MHGQPIEFKLFSVGTQDKCNQRNWSDWIISVRSNHLLFGLCEIKCNGITARERNELWSVWVTAIDAVEFYGDGIRKARISCERRNQHLNYES